MNDNFGGAQGVDEYTEFTSLGDKDIRELLIERLESSSRPPKAILEELRVHNGNAIADVVAVHSFAHCYEIKSDRDSIDRALIQAQYYDLVFRRVTLVTTEKHLQRALKVVPMHWGIIIAKATINRRTLSYYRAASNTPRFNKELALLTLWKSELAEVALPYLNQNVSKINRARLTSIIAEKIGVHELVKHIGSQLIMRQLKL